MSKNSTAAWNRYTVEESALLGYQSVFLLLLSIRNACSNVSLFHKHFEESSSLRYLGIYSQTKLSTALTENEHGKNSRYNNDSFTKETLH